MEFRISLLGLQFQVDFIKGRQRLAEIHGLADLDQAFCHLARHPKAHIGLDARADGADKAARGRFRLVVHGGHQNRARRGRLFRRQLIAAGQRDRHQRQR